MIEQNVIGLYLNAELFNVIIKTIIVKSPAQLKTIENRDFNNFDKIKIGAEMFIMKTIETCLALTQSIEKNNWKL